MNHDTNLRGRFTPQPPGGNLETPAATSALVARWRGDYTLQVSHRNGEMVSTGPPRRGLPCASRGEKLRHNRLLEPPPVPRERLSGHKHEVRAELAERHVRPHRGTVDVLQPTA